MKELYKADLYDLELLSNGELSLENISACLLKNSVFYNFTTIYAIESAHNRYDRSLSENKKLGTNKDEKSTVDSEKKSVECSKMVFVDCLE